MRDFEIDFQPPNAPQRIHGPVGLDDPNNSVNTRQIDTPVRPVRPFEERRADPGLPPIELGLDRRFEMSPVAQKLMSQVDASIRRGHLRHALDLTMLAESLTPGELPVHLRHAELLLALGNSGGAVSIARNVRRIAEIGGNHEFAIDLERLNTHAHPNPVNLVSFAQLILDHARDDLADGYVPLALKALHTLGDNASAATMASQWHQLRPENQDALVAVVLSYIRAQRQEKIPTVLAGAAKSGDYRYLMLQLLNACNRQDVEQWHISADLCRRIRSGELEAAPCLRLIDQFEQYLTEDANLAIHRGLIQQAAGEHQAAMPRLLETKTNDMVATFIATIHGASSAIQLNKLHHAADAVRLAIQLQREPAIVAFIEQEPGHRLKAELIATSQDLADRFLSNNLSVSAADILGKLASLDPNAWNIGRQHAEALARAGEREEALARLAVILTEEQQAGNPLGTIQTMHSILRIVPGNLRMRKRLVDELMKRGMLAEAVVEFRAQAEILERANRRDDAVAQLTRGVQIAATLRDWATVEEFYDHMLRLNPDDIDLRHGAVTTFLECGRVELAVKQLWDIVTISISRNDSDASVAALHQLIALAPNDTTAFHRLGEILASIGEYAQAERVYRRLAVYLPDDPAVKAKQSALAALAREQIT